MKTKRNEGIMKVGSRAPVTVSVCNSLQKEFPFCMAQKSCRRSVADSETSPKQPETNYSQANVYLDTLKPIFLVLTLTGTLPVCRLNKGNPKVRVLLSCCVCLMIYAFFGYLTYLMTLHVLQLILHDEDFSSIIVQVSLIMLLSQHVFYLVITWPESIYVSKYLTQWQEFQTEYERVTNSHLQLFCRVKSSLWLVSSALVSVACAFTTDIMDDKVIKSKAHFIVIFHQFFIQLSFFQLWFSNGWAIIETARQYYSNLEKECDLDILPEKLEDYRLLWMRLTELVRAGSSMLSYTMAIIVISPFTFEVIAAYNLTVYTIHLIQGAPADSMEAAATTVAFLFYGFLLYVFCNSGHCMTNECEKIQDILLRHKPRSPTTLSKVNYELRLFLRSVKSAPPLASLSGYVTVNRKVFLHMSGVLLTYLIILVQFNMNSILSVEQTVT